MQLRLSSFGPDIFDIARYRDPETGKTWNGFGRPPTWIRGKDRALFRIDQDCAT